MSIAVRYTLDLRCDFCADQRAARFATFTGHSMAEAHATRRAAGWYVFPAQSLAKCPACYVARRARKAVV